MSDKQMTAVEWFEQKLDDLDIEIPQSIFEQAKEMEKEQIIKFAFDFYYDFSNKLGVPFNLISENRLNAEQYYNETFKSENIVMFMTPENGEIESIILTDNPDCGVKGITFKSE